MTTYAFKLPDIGEGIAQAEIVGWKVGIGDWVSEDDPIADVMTDKATVEMSAPVSGRLLQIGGAEGDQIAIGSMLAVFELEGEETPDSIPLVQMDMATAELASTTHEMLAQVATVSNGSSEQGPAPSDSHLFGAPPRSARADRVAASPAVRGRAKELGIPLSEVRPGADRRIRHADLDAFLRYSESYRPSGAARKDEAIRVIGLRRRVAENMAAAKRNIPHFSYIEEIDVTKLEALRADLNATRGERPRITILPLLAVALCRTVPAFPMMNALYDEDIGIVTRKGAVHLGIATQTDAGLMVPVVRDAHSLNIWQLANEIARLAAAARDGTIRAAELSGSTLTITSLGPLGGIATTPVINRPEVAILGPNKVVERPVVRDGRIEVAKVMNLSVSCDHRVVDGWDAASFVQAMKRLIETPALLFVD
ncbi:2-oxoisovalerate dehydrogenase E2 component (dihydrolipoyl transacylase) [Novosphingobium sp. PhB165]|uniref:dihydrolipoamide acetyltransferase family protein n=1 Tax=Novosphingobium sp. PhB165 TaxID=2485105 RepID=UPI0010446366|nr:dihydrolipoamide acetyltransferase family protein [Novosphingobium sp. PhB165]TCM20715.1 2-oxoisovalerate dehydrogenase E2 component (dihydrolipoyl transacylase) [Novosphingobium sp. PhB165]